MKEIVSRPWDTAISYIQLEGVNWDCLRPSGTCGRPTPPWTWFKTLVLPFPMRGGGGGQPHAHLQKTWSPPGPERGPREGRGCGNHSRLTLTDHPV